MSDLPTVSIIIPTYNRAQYLLIAVESALKQTLSDIEIIVVDDGSTDNTRDVLRPFADRIRCIKTDNMGAAHARNTGMKAARGSYIAFLDSDDLYYDYKLELQVDFLEKYTQNSVACTDFSGIFKDGSIDTYHMRNYHDVWRKKNLDYLDIFGKKGQFHHKNFSEPIDFYTGDIFKHVIFEPILPSNTLLFKREILEIVGYQDESIRSGQDYEFVVRICKYFDMAFLDIPTYKIRHHGDQLSKSNFLLHKNVLLREIDNIDLVRSVFEKWAYGDKEFFRNNKEMVNKRMCELYFRTALLWTEYGDSEKSKYWKHQCKPFKSFASPGHRFLWGVILFNLPTKLGSNLFKIKRGLKKKYLSNTMFENGDVNNGSTKDNIKSHQ